MSDGTFKVNKLSSSEGFAKNAMNQKLSSLIKDASKDLQADQAKQVNLGKAAQKEQPQTKVSPKK